jgi:hypothetical protein
LEVLTAVKMSMLVFWVLRRVGLELDIFSPEDGGSMFLLKLGISVQVHTVLQPRKPTSTTVGDLVCVADY